jgi:hypothetical protein
MIEPKLPKAATLPWEAPEFEIRPANAGVSHGFTITESLS